MTRQKTRELVKYGHIHFLATPHEEEFDYMTKKLVRELAIDALALGLVKIEKKQGEDEMGFKLTLTVVVPE